MLAGSLRTLPIEDLFDWLARRAPVGVLKLERGTAHRVFHVDSGHVTFASSNLPGEQLSQLLLGRGLVDDAALAEAFRVQGQTGVLVGKILVLTDVIEEVALRDILVAKIHEAICDALTWTEGTFRFSPGSGDAFLELAVSVDLGVALVDGLAQVERRRELRRLVPSDDAVFWLRDRNRGATSAELERLLACVERGLSVNQIVLEHNGNRLQVFERLAALLDAGAIQHERRTRRREANNSGLDPAGIAAAARGRAAGGDRAGAWKFARECLEEHPESEDLRELYRGLERGLLAELTRELLASFRVPRLKVTHDALATEPLDDAERYVASRVDGRWDLLSLVRVAPLGEVEALLAFRRLAERGIVEL